MILNYKIFENVIKSEEVLNDLNIPLDDKNYIYIKKLTKRFPKHLSILTKLHFNYGISLSEIVSIYSDLIKYNVPITSHLSTPEEVDNIIKRDKGNAELEEILKCIPSYMIGYRRGYVTTRTKNLIKNNLEHSDIIKKFLYSGRYRLSNLYRDINKLIKKDAESCNSDWTIDHIKYNENEFLYSNDDESILILKIPSYSRHKKLGSPNWDSDEIEREWKGGGVFGGMLKHTRKHKYIEYIIYDFNKERCDDHSIVSVIVSNLGILYKSRLYSGEEFDIIEDITYRKYFKYLPTLKFLSQSDFFKSKR